MIKIFIDKKAIISTRAVIFLIELYHGLIKKAGKTR